MIHSLLLVKLVL